MWMVNKNVVFWIIFELDFNPNLFYPVICAYHNVVTIFLIAFRKPFFTLNMIFKPFMVCKWMFFYPLCDLRF